MKDSGSTQLIPNLQDTPGWVSLSSKKRDELFAIALDNHQFRQMKGLGEFGELMTMYQAAQVLEGEGVQLRDFIARLYPERHYRTVLRKEKAFEEFAARIPGAVLKRLSGLGTEVLSRFDRIASAALGDIRNAVREMPQLPAATQGDAEKYLAELDGKLLERQKRKGKPVKKDASLAEKMAANAVLHYMRDAGLKTSAEKRQFLIRVVGWVMEAQAVHGTLRAGRIPIPDGILIKRGRPPKKRPQPYREPSRGGSAASDPFRLRA